MTEEGQILTLDKKDYIIVHRINIDGKYYDYLVSDFEPIETMIVREFKINNNVVIKTVDDENELVAVLKKVASFEEE